MEPAEIRDTATATVRRWVDGFGAVPDPAAPVDPTDPIDCPCLDWATSGAMALTGHADGPPVLSPARAVPLIRAVAEAFRPLGAAVAHPARVDPLPLLTGRAALRGLTRRGRTSAGGATRLLRAADGWCAVTLSRADDVDLVPALLGRADVGDPWSALARAARSGAAQDLAARARLLGIPAAALDLPAAGPPGSGPPVPGPPWRVTRIAPPAPRRPGHRPLVVDLSSLWAGPLCADLLHRSGARVVKVESTRRPDGARPGDRRFFDWLHTGHESVAVDFTTGEGRNTLALLVDTADVVIEASRPRALRQLGLDPERRAHRPGKVWIGITGYGRADPDPVAFGDDAAVAGGLVGWTDGQPVFCGDAVADPLTGLVAALAALASLAAGGGHHVDVAMRDVAAAFAGGALVPGGHKVHRFGSRWVIRCPRQDRALPVAPPAMPRIRGSAVALGADTERVLWELAQDQGARHHDLRDPNHLSPGCD